MRLNVGPISLNVFEPSGWEYATSQEGDVCVGLSKFVSIGVSGGTLTVQQTRHDLKNQGQKYRLAYGAIQVGAGLGLSALGPVTVSGSPESFDSGAFGRIYRLPASPDASGEGGKPTGFLGTFTIVSVGFNMPVGRNVSALFLGGIDVPILNQTLTFKYVTFIWGTSLSSAISVGGTGTKGTMFKLDTL